MVIKPYCCYDEQQLLPLYRAVGWHNYHQRPEMLRSAYAHSLCILGAYEADRLVGIIRAVGDGHSIVFIQDILVHPAHQRQGIGTALMRSLLAQYPHVYQIQLSTDNTTKSAAFYRSLGFRPLTEIGCCGMMHIP